MKKPKAEASVTVLVFPVGRPPESRVISNTLGSMQQVVDGYAEAVPLQFPYMLYCNEEGLMLQLSLNRVVNGHRIHGQFFVTKHRQSDDGELMVSLDELMVSLDELDVIKILSNVPAPPA